jgi:hypothetical protein
LDAEAKALPQKHSRSTHCARSGEFNSTLGTARQSIHPRTESLESTTFSRLFSF